MLNLSVYEHLVLRIELSAPSIVITRFLGLGTLRLACETNLAMSFDILRCLFNLRNAYGPMLGGCLLLDNWLPLGIAFRLKTR